MNETLLVSAVSALAALPNELASAAMGIPLEFIREEVPLVTVPVTIGGRGPLRFILDTGNATTGFLLSERAAAKLGLAGRETTELPAPSGVGKEPIRLLAATAKTVEVGPFRYENAPVAISAALDKLSAAIGREIDGNLGFPFLKDYSLTLDYPRHTLRLAPSRATEDAGDDAAIPFNLGSPKPLILLWVNMNGRGPFRVALDTGAGSTIVSTELARSFALPEGAAVPMFGAGGAAGGFASRLDSLAIGAAALRDVDVVVADIFAPLRTATGGELDGILGYNVLRRFAVTIDYPARRLRLASPAAK